MKNRHLLFLLCCCLAAAPSSAKGPRRDGPASPQSNQAPTGTPLAQSLIAAQKAVIDASTRKDTDFLKRTLTDDFIEVGSNGGTSDKLEFLNDVRTGDGQPPRIYDMKVVPLNDNAAIVTWSQIDPGGTPKYVHLSAVWVKQGDRWKLKFQQSTPNVWSANDQ